MTITAEIARELLRYEPETGKLFWRKRDRKWFATDRDFKCWNTRFAKKEAFTSDDGYGYRQGRIFDRLYRAHRVIWLMQTGTWPRNDIDHINHNRSDNRWLNLRAVTRSENMKNASLPKDNTSGAVGVSWCKQTEKWKAQIKANGIQTSLGYFEKLEDAIATRKAAERKYGFHKNHGADDEYYTPEPIGVELAGIETIQRVL